RLVEAVQLHQACDRRRLAARDDQAVEAVELSGQAHLDGLRTEASQDGRVLAEVPLDCQDADPKRLLHRADCRGGYTAGSGGAGSRRRRRQSRYSPSRTKKNPTTAKTTIGTQFRSGAKIEKFPLATHSIVQCVAAATKPIAPSTAQLERHVIPASRMKRT